MKHLSSYDNFRRPWYNVKVASIYGHLSLFILKIMESKIGMIMIFSEISKSIVKAIATFMSALRKEPVVKSEESHSYLLVMLLGYFHMGLTDKVPLIFRKLHLGGSLVNPADYF